MATLSWTAVYKVRPNSAFMAAAWETAATQSISRPCKYIDNDTDICNNVVSMLATTAAKEENDDDSMNANK